MNKLVNRTALAALALVVLSSGASAAPSPQGDGWHGWEVEAVDGAPAWCCYSWQGGTPAEAGCDLDDGHQGYGTSNQRRATTGKMNVYVRLDGGRVQDIRTVATSCPVESESGIEWLGAQPADASVAWLRRQLDAGDRHVSSGALASIAVHAGAAASRTLVDTARHDDDIENRKDAVFWMGQARARASAPELRAIMFDDPDPTLREHATFSWSQADVPRRAETLRELALSDDSTKVRGQAWFWLAQTGDESTEHSIFSALRSESSRKVRHQAIFALSQLPGERGVEALVHVVEDRALDDKDRKQAIFWLAQSESPRAVDYLARVLD